MAYDIPLQQQIQRHILYDPEFEALLVDWGELPRSSEGIICNMQDGNISKQHPHLSGRCAEGSPKRLAFATYADDVEVVNPIGAARVKHKVTLYYATILNIPWHMRSKLDHIYVVGVILSKTQRALAPVTVVQGLPRGAQVYIAYR